MSEQGARLTLVPLAPRVRLDKRGRRIGANWWREHIVTTLGAAESAWQARRESGQPIHTGLVAGADYDTGYYQLSDAEYRLIHPRPTLKGLLLAHAGIATSPAAEPAA